VYLVTFQAEYMGRAFSYLNALRQAFAQQRGAGKTEKDIICDMCYRKLSPKTLMKWADKIRARNVVILGEEEVKGGFVTLRNMRTGEQEQVSVAGGDFCRLTDTLRERCLKV